MAPPGIKVLLCERPEDRISWSPDALFRWYIGLSLKKYCCHQILIPVTNSDRIGKSVSWFPHKLIIPTVTATDIVIGTTKYLTAALKKIDKKSLLSPYNIITRRALFQLYSILSHAYSSIKPEQPPTFKLPRVFAPKPIAAPTMVSPSTKYDFHNISPTTEKHGRDL